MIIGITGSFGSGKTTVARMFARCGAYVIDADKICHSLILPPKGVYKKLIKHFGVGILKKNKTIDRKKLARIVFKEISKLNLLNKLVHPEAIKEINKILRKNKGRRVIVIDAPLLIESGFYKEMDKIVVVRSEITQQVARVNMSLGMDRKEVLERINMQVPIDEKTGLADFIIDNSASKRQTFIQVQEIWKQLGVDYACK